MLIVMRQPRIAVCMLKLILVIPGYAICVDYRNGTNYQQYPGADSGVAPQHETWFLVRSHYHGSCKSYSTARYRLRLMSYSVHSVTNAQCGSKEVDAACGIVTYDWERLSPMSDTPKICSHTEPSGVHYIVDSHYYRNIDTWFR